MLSLRQSPTVVSQHSGLGPSAGRRYSGRGGRRLLAERGALPDIAHILQELVRGLDLGTALALRPHSPVGYGLLALGLALCLIGYWLYRLMVSLAAALAGGALAYLVMPGFDVAGLSLWSTVLGAMMVSFVLGWFLYPVAVFLVGAFVGLILGLVLWLLTAQGFTSLAELRSLAIGGSDLPSLAAAAILPALALGILALRWERGIVTLVAVVLGGLALALGLRYSRLPGPFEVWGPAAAGVIVALGLFLHFRPLPRGSGRRRRETGDR